MAQDKQTAPATAQPNIAEELGKMAYEPLLPIERKLITWGLSLGVALLVVLVVVSRVIIHIS